MYYFIVNPSSRSGNGRLIWNTIEQILEQEQIEYRVFFTAYRYHATRLAREITSSKDKLTLVAVGGDGTVNEIVNGIQDFSRVTFAYIPTGSSNDFARSLGLPVNPEAAIQNILHPSLYRKIDLGLVVYGKYKRYFAGSCGCGFDAAVCHEAIACRSKDFLNRIKLGKLTYIWIALKQILLFRPFPMTITLDNEKELSFRRTYFVSPLNCAYEGGGLKLCPKAKPDDGLLDLCIVESLSKLTIALMFPTAYIGRHTIFRGIHIYHAKTVDIHTNQTVSLHTDGEPEYVQDDIHVSCVPKCLTVIAGNAHISGKIS